jgi:hypothetical protein
VAKSKLDRAKDLPWLMMLQGAVVLGRRWTALSEKDRARLTRILRDSGGRMGRLSAKERAELRRLAGKLDLKGASRELMLIRAARRSRKRR